ncbi:5'(3')-deoxyribonucleotidase [Muriicola jejuensis]|uniref:Uncharacterized protein n=1 Tax=Muriicola jejuensis TaxID=504488 RepID=A0A6P0UFK6_9FLAO|nr:hypothetical protein [Muriicola jejuensis]NER10023.1 hypothetical protein [Muriicola jejuensis]SMP03681.1 5'(3')-deoxyribonucleotidase [Muriicola jejuensis]
MNRKKIIYVNIDGILAELESKMFQQIKSIVHNHNYEFRSAMYEMVPPAEGGVQAVESLLNIEEFNVYFISTPIWGDTDAWSEKKEWLCQLFKLKKVRGRLILSHQKHLLRGDYLIDQSWQYGSKNFQGEWIQIGVDPQFPRWKEVMKYLMSQTSN